MSSDSFISAKTNFNHLLVCINELLLSNSKMNSNSNSDSVSVSVSDTALRMKDKTRTVLQVRFEVATANSMGMPKLFMGSTIVRIT